MYAIMFCVLVRGSHVLCSCDPCFSSAELSWNLRRADDLKRHRAHLVSVSLLDLGLGFDLSTAVLSWMQYHADLTLL